MVRKREYETDGQQIWGYDFFVRGVRYRKAGFPTKAEAEIAELNARQQALKRKHPPKPSSFAGVVELFLEHRAGRRAEQTVDREKRRAKTLLKYFKQQKILSITQATIEAYVKTRLKEKRKPRTINLELSFLSSLFKFAEAHGYVYENPAKGVEYLKVVQKEKQIPTDAEFDRFAEEAGKLRDGSELKTWIICLAYTGMRPNESLFLQWRDVDFENDQIKVQPKDGNPLKNRRFRVIPMHPTLKKLLLEWRDEWRNKTAKLKKRDRHDWLWIHPQHPNRRAKGFRKGFDTAAQRAQIQMDNLTPYTLRHYFISKAIMSQMDYLALRSFTGHSSIAMIERVYGHLRDDFRSREMAKLKIGSDGAGEQK